jgi:hypothetical protein
MALTLARRHLLEGARGRTDREPCRNNRVAVNQDGKREVLAHEDTALDHYTSLNYGNACAGVV